MNKNLEYLLRMYKQVRTTKPEVREEWEHCFGKANIIKVLHEKIMFYTYLLNRVLL